jgi:hypothetical protein
MCRQMRFVSHADVLILNPLDNISIEYDVSSASEDFAFSVAFVTLYVFRVSSHINQLSTAVRMFNHHKRWPKPRVHEWAVSTTITCIAPENLEKPSTSAKQ